MVTIDTISARGHPRRSGPRPGRVLRPLRHRARAGAHRRGAPWRPPSAEHGDGPCVVTGPIAVRGAEPGDILRVDVLGPRPARALRRRLQPPRGRRRARRVACFTPRPPGRRRLPRLPAGLAPAARRVPARSVHGDHGRRGRRADLQRGPRRRLEPVPAGARARARSSSPAIPHYVREGAFALEAPLRATFRLHRSSPGARPPSMPTVAGLLGRAARPPGRDDAAARCASRWPTSGDELGMPRALAFAHLSAASRLL